MLAKKGVTVWVGLLATVATAAAGQTPNFYQLVEQLKKSGPCATTAQMCLAKCPASARDPVVEIECRSGCDTARAQCALDKANRQLKVTTDEYICLSPRTNTWEAFKAAGIAEAKAAAGGDYRVNCRAMTPGQDAAAQASLANRAERTPRGR